MLAYLRHPSTPIWLLLILATGLSWWLGHETTDPGKLRHVATALIVVAAIKIRLVVRYFMEVRDAPRPLKLALDAWLLAMSGTILGIYWLGLPA